MQPDIELIVVTPERQLLREMVVEVTIPGLDGELGVLPGHAPLITELGIGELSYKTKSGVQSAGMAVISGFAEVLPERVTILAESAERAGEIDVARAERALAKAKERLSANDPNIDWLRASRALQRSLIRIQVTRKYHGQPVAR